MVTFSETLTETITIKHLKLTLKHGISMKTFHFSFQTFPPLLKHVKPNLRNNRIFELQKSIKYLEEDIERVYSMVTFSETLTATNTIKYLKLTLKHGMSIKKFTL